MERAAVEAGAPANSVGCLRTLSMQATDELMHSDYVKLIIATGGPAMVKAAYSAGKPAIGVGAGNSPAYIEKTANVHDAVEKIMASKTFDNGTVCASEQSIIAEEANELEVIDELEKQGAYFMTAEETAKVCDLLFKNGHTMNAKFVAKKPEVIAKAAGIEIPFGTRLLVGRQTGVGEGNPLSYEKLTTVIAFYTVEDWHEACDLSIALLQNGIGAAKPSSRILVNTGGTQGGSAASTGLSPSFTLGCGTMGGSSVSENVTPLHLINKKVLAYGIKDVRTLAADDAIFQKYHGNEKPTTCKSANVSITPDELKEMIVAVIKAME